jgi:hypothetical protein
MKIIVSVILDVETGRVQIDKPKGHSDSWDDLAILMEGVGILAKVCVNNGITEHKGKPLKEYLQWYIGEVYDKCLVAVTVHGNDH